MATKKRRAGRYHREPGTAGPGNYVNKAISPFQPVITARWLGPYRGGSGRGPARAGSRTTRRAEYVAGILAARKATRSGNAASLGVFKPGVRGGTPAFRAGIRRGQNVGSFKGRAGSWVKGKGGRFVGSK